MSLIIVAYNINSGGGRVLLDQLLNSLSSKESVEVWLDERMKPLSHPGLKINWVRPHLWNRFKAEWDLSKYKERHTFLYFGNLPPLFSSSVGGKVFVYLQNKYVINSKSVNTASNTSIVRSFLERIWFKYRFKTSYVCLVQTRLMQNDFHKFMGPRFRCEIAPFFDNLFPQKKTDEIEKKFIYISSFDSHKNHETLIEALKILIAEGISLKMKFVFDQQKSPALVQLINKNNRSHGIQLSAIGPLSRAEIVELYSDSSTLIFPSTFESFGLPLIEAKNLGLDIIAPELDYVREIVDPKETFDPNSALSIASAIKRYLGIKEAKVEILSAKEFVRKFFN